MARSFSRLSSSAQLLSTGVVLECVNLLLCALAVIPFADANVATALLLLLLVVGGLASSVALVCALVVPSVPRDQYLLGGYFCSG